MTKETDKEVEDASLKALGGLVVIIGTLIYLIWVNALVGFEFYNWFIKPQLNTPEFTFNQFVGFSFFVKSLNYKGSSDNIKKEYKESGRFWYTLFIPWVFYLIGMLFYTIAH